MIADAQNSLRELCSIEPRADGVMLVRVRSRHGLPDAVFTFRVGDPQYEYWKQQLDLQDANEAAAN